MIRPPDRLWVVMLAPQPAGRDLNWYSAKRAVEMPVDAIHEDVLAGHVPGSWR